jgi:Tfp pilus assembly protein PilE
MLYISKELKGNIRKGTTLVELMVYLAVFGFIFISIIGFTLNISEAHRVANERKAIQKDIIFISEHLRDSFTTATSIDSNSSIFTSNNGKLVLGSSSGNIEYSIVSSKLNLLKSSQNTYLTNPSIRISKFYLEQVKSRDNSIVGVKIKMTLYDANNPKSISNMESMYLLK